MQQASPVTFSLSPDLPPGIFIDRDGRTILTIYPKSLGKLVGIRWVQRSARAFELVGSETSIIVRVTTNPPSIDFGLDKAIPLRTHEQAMTFRELMRLYSSMSLGGDATIDHLKILIDTLNEAEAPVIAPADRSGLSAFVSFTDSDSLEFKTPSNVTMQVKPNCLNSGKPGQYWKLESEPLFGFSLKDGTGEINIIKFAQQDHGALAFSPVGSFLGKVYIDLKNHRQAPDLQYLMTLYCTLSQAIHKADDWNCRRLRKKISAFLKSTDQTPSEPPAKPDILKLYSDARKATIDSCLERWSELVSRAGARRAFPNGVRMKLVGPPPEKFLKAITSPQYKPKVTFKNEDTPAWFVTLEEVPAKRDLSPKRAKQ